MDKLFRYAIDEVVIERKDENIRIRGWAFHEKESIKLIDPTNLTANIFYENREDVRKKIQILDDKNVCGFMIDIPLPETRYIKLVFQTVSGGQYIVRLDVSFRGICIRTLRKILSRVKSSVQVKLQRMQKKIKAIGWLFSHIQIRQIYHMMIFFHANGFRKTLSRIKSRLGLEISYEDWRKRHIPKEAELDIQKKAVFVYMPKISLIVPAYNTPIRFLNEMIISVIEQTYANWELCIADGSDTSDVWQCIGKWKDKDSRIKAIRLKENEGISGNSNRALELAEGEYIALFDHDDLLTADALYEVVRVLNSGALPRADFIYTDEDKVDETGKKFFSPHFKPDFSPDMLRSINYICHFTVIQERLLNKVGKCFMPQYDGAQDYDLILRCTEQAQNIQHISKVLYHWRMHSGSTAANPGSKSYTHIAGKKAIGAHLARVGKDGTVLDNVVDNLYNVIYSIKCKDMVSIIIPNCNHKFDLQKCIESVFQKTTYDNYEILVIENNSTDSDIFEYYNELARKPNVRILYWQGEFNYSAINNWAVKESHGKYILFLNNDIEIITPEWLDNMVMFCQYKEYGAVGAKLYYPDNTIQHAGVILGIGGVAGHSHKHYDRTDYGYFNRLVMVQNLSAVTAALMMVRRDVFDEVCGFEEEFKVAFNDVDLCMKIRKAGYLIIFNPNVEAWHYESKSRGTEDSVAKRERFSGEVQRFYSKWGSYIEDCYYNNNLSIEQEDFSLKV